MNDKPIEVPASAVSSQSGTAVRDILLVVSALPALLAVLGQKDLQAVVRFLGSTEFAPALGVLVTAGVFGWRQWLARKKHAEAVAMAQSAANHVAVVKP